MTRLTLGHVSAGAFLAALYNNSSPRGMGWLIADPKPLTPEIAEALFMNGDRRLEFHVDYLGGRPIKVTLYRSSPDEPWVEAETRLYDRDFGEGAAEGILDGLKGGA